MPAAVEAWARALATRDEVERIVWCGSFVAGTPTPRSDTDVCVVVHDGAQNMSGIPRHQRGADYLPSTPTPVPFDLAVLTASEHAAVATWAPAWARALSAGRVLFDRASA